MVSYQRDNSNANVAIDPLFLMYYYMVNIRVDSASLVIYTFKKSTSETKTLLSILAHVNAKLFQCV